MNVQITDSKLTEFLVWANENRGIDPELSKAVVKQMGLTELEYIVTAVKAPTSTTVSNIQGFIHFNETLAFYEKNLTFIKDWLKTEAESLSNVFDSTIAMIMTLPGLQSEAVTADEVGELLYRSSKENRNDDQGLYEVFANEISNVIASRVIDYYSDFTTDTV